MKWTNTLIPTLRENPQDAEVASHRLMLRAGLIRKITAGSYAYLPLGFKALRKVEGIIREEMDSAGGLEVLMPAIQPIELWKKTGRDAVLGDVLIKYKDRHGRTMALGPTHEEVVTEITAAHISSYKDLPKTIYQMQTKFRDEVRPRFGVIRSCEFIMKDAYSFDADEEGLEKSYKKMFDAYTRIFTRCGLKYIAVEADPGIMGGKSSHEFMVPSPAGEDEIGVCKCGYGASVQVAECKKPDTKTKGKEKETTLEEVETPGVSTVEKVGALLKVEPTRIIKTIIYKADGLPLALLVRGDYEVNETKLKNSLKSETLAMADEKSIEALTGGPLGFSGPVGLKGIKIIADYSVLGIVNAVTGANKKDRHLVNVNPERDFKVDKWLDARHIKENDPCPKCDSPIKLEHAIEIGHTFKLGTKYTKALSANYLDSKGAARPMVMGCYGIGVNRILAAALEISNDKDGIIWPVNISPYEVAILPLNMDDKKVRDAAYKLYDEMRRNRMDVIIDDREARAGVKFKDADLIGFPIQVVLGKGLEKGEVEVNYREKSKKGSVFPPDKILDGVKFMLDKLRSP